MKTKLIGGIAVGRREFLCRTSAGAIGGAAMLTTAPFVGEVLAGNETADERRNPHYNANSTDIQAFYRVNHYPATKK